MYQTLIPTLSHVTNKIIQVDEGVYKALVLEYLQLKAQQNKLNIQNISIGGINGNTLQNLLLASINNNQNNQNILSNTLFNSSESDISISQDLKTSIDNIKIAVQNIKRPCCDGCEMRGPCCFWPCFSCNLYFKYFCCCCSLLLWILYSIFYIIYAIIFLVIFLISWFTFCWLFLCCCCCCGECCCDCCCCDTDNSECCHKNGFTIPSLISDINLGYSLEVKISETNDLNQKVELGKFEFNV